MFYWLTELAGTIPGINVFRYITFRTGGAMVTGALFVFLFGPWIITRLRLAQGKGQPIRADGPPTHLVTKKGTPTMGGLMILSGLIVATLLWANLRNPYVWIVLLVTLGFGLVGFYDDYLKVSKQTDKGFSGRSRLAVEALIALVACSCIVWFGRNATVTALSIPFVKEFMLNIGWFYVMFGMFIIVGAGNAVNLTDGLDGLAIVPVMIAAASFGMIAYLVGNAVFAEYLQIHYVAGTGELAVLCGAVLGRGAWIPLVQRAAGLDLHGRHWLARARRHARRDRRRHQARDRAGDDRRAVRGRGAVGHRAGGVVQAHRQALLPHGADSSSLRAEGMDRAADRDPVLDRLSDAGAGRSFDAEAAVKL